MSIPELSASSILLIYNDRSMIGKCGVKLFLCYRLSACSS